MKDLAAKKASGGVLGINLKLRKGAIVVCALVLAMIGPATANADSLPIEGHVHYDGNGLAAKLSRLAPGSTAWGSPSLPGRTLVLYDVSGPWGWLGQLNAEAIGNLASHSGLAVAQPVADYLHGEIARFTDVIYVGSSYNEPIPTAFLTDVQSSSTPVLWMGDNSWELDNASAGVTAAFVTKYGWDPSTSYFDLDNVSTVSYNGTNLSRNPLAGGIIAPNITNASLVSSLALANCTSSVGTATPCLSQARVNGATSFPWAITSSNLTFIGENPISYMRGTDRYLILADLVERLISPNVTSHQALVRLEDVNVNDSTANLLAIGTYLHDNQIPFSINVIPNYMDPLGTYTQGVPQNIPLDSPQAATFVATLKQLVQMGGTLVMEGYTHQYSNIPNPYDATSGDDFEFYRAQCSSVASAPYSFDLPCATNDWVIEEGPVPGDSFDWASGRISAGLGEFRSAKLPKPKFFVTPHYAASAVDYQAFAGYFGSNRNTASYDRRLYFGGQLTGPSSVNYNEVLGQFFPYTVHDLYGSTVIPENLGDYEPVTLNNHPARSTQDIVKEAADNLVVRDGYASFFYDPSYGTTALSQIITGIQGLGYHFVSPNTLLGNSSTTTYGNALT